VSDRADEVFRRLYANPGADYENIPWSSGGPRPALVEWLDTQPPGDGAPALVVACGLGDDAEELARRGYAVTAFDLVPAAIEAAHRRFPDSVVDYRVADLFELPAGWSQAFALVVEIQTIQSLPPSLQADAVTAIAACVAPGGRVFVRVASGRLFDNGPPWPVAPEVLDRFPAAGCALVERRASDETHDHLVFARQKSG
jgi:2-polyprenyl-3-methyl-5-hydroxy-6-metoxy-1,4-benzoquinol methylase